MVCCDFPDNRHHRGDGNSGSVPEGRGQATNYESNDILYEADAGSGGGLGTYSTHGSCRQIVLVVLTITSIVFFLGPDNN